MASLAAETLHRMDLDSVSIDMDDLWRCFTIYSILGTPHEPLVMRMRQFVGLLRACLLPDRCGLERHQAEIIFRRHAKGLKTTLSMRSRIHNRHTLSKKRPTRLGKHLNFTDFIDAMFAISKICFPKMHPMDALKVIVQNFMLPNALSEDVRLPFGTSLGEAKEFLLDGSLVNAFDS